MKNDTIPEEVIELFRRYREYLQLCDKKGVQPKAHNPWALTEDMITELETM